MRKKIVLGLIILAAGGVFISRFISKPKQPQFQTVRVERGTLISAVSASGQILGANFLEVKTGAVGIVKRVYVKNGDRVWAGGKIAEVELDLNGGLKYAQDWAALISASNSLNAANNNYRSTQAVLANVYDQVKGHDKDETYAQRETRTKAEVANDNAYDATKTAAANLTAANLNFRLNSPIITAPVSGTIDNLIITPGVPVTAEKVAVIRREGNPIASFNVSEVDVSRMTPGLKVTVTLDAVSGKTFTGKVLTVDKIGTVDSGVTNYPVTVSLESTAGEILPNMAATANIILETKDNVLLVPSGAIQNQTVRVLKKGRARGVKVETGISSDTQIEIVAGLAEGETVVTGTNSTQNGSASPFSTFRFVGTTRR